MKKDHVSHRNLTKKRHVFVHVWFVIPTWRYGTKRFVTSGGQTKTKEGTWFRHGTGDVLSIGWYSVFLNALTMCFLCIFNLPIRFNSKRRLFKILPFCTEDFIPTIFKMFSICPSIYFWWAMRDSLKFLIPSHLYSYIVF